MAKKAVTSKQKKQPVKEIKKHRSSNFFDYFRFGESYTSLIIRHNCCNNCNSIVLSFVHNKNAGNVNAPISEQTQNTVQVSQQASDLARKAPSNTVDNVATVTPTQVLQLPNNPCKTNQPIVPTVPVKPTATSKTNTPTSST